eukprot:1524448-Amphidinium_carterae.1
MIVWGPVLLPMCRPSRRSVYDSCSKGCPKIAPTAGEHSTPRRGVPKVRRGSEKRSCSLKRQYLIMSLPGWWPALVMLQRQCNQGDTGSTTNSS